MQIGIVRAENDQVIWPLTITNGPTSNSNVQVTFTLPSEISFNNSTILPIGSYTGIDVWTIGAMTPNQVINANIVLNFDGPIGGLSEEYSIVATVTGLGDTNGTNNVKTDTILFEVSSCDPLASGSNCISGLKFDLSACSTPCTQGATALWNIVALSEVNINIISFNVNTGIGYYEFIDPSLPGSFTWGLSCVLGLDTVVICSTYTMTLHPLIDDKDVFDHSADFIEGSTLTAPQIALLKAQPAYSGLTNEQIQAYCWEALYNADGDLVGGWAHDCTGEQDSRHFIFCSEVTCDNTPNPCPSCPYSDMPVDVSAYLTSITNYTAEKGDLITIYHIDATAVWEYNGTAWERTSCGCQWKISQDADNILTLGTDNAPYLSDSDLPVLNPYPVSFTVTGTTTKTATITLSNATVLTTNFTDIDTNTTYTVEINDGNIELIDQMNNVVSSVPLPAAVGDDWGVQVVEHDATIAGNGTVASPLTIAQQGATNGQVLKWNTASSTWLPANDTDTDTGEVNTASNIGGGEELFSAKVGVDLQFRTLVAGDNVTITEVGDTLEIETSCGCCNCFVDTIYDISGPELHLVQSGECDRITGDIIWQSADVFANPPVFTTLQTGGSTYTFIGSFTERAIRIQYTEDGCTKYSPIRQIVETVATP